MSKELLQELRDTLEFYAKESNWHEMECPSTGTTLVEDDKGTRAQYAMERIDEELIALGEVAHG